MKTGRPKLALLRAADEAAQVQGLVTACSIPPTASGPVRG
jgi:hypothetical protein